MEPEIKTEEGSYVLSPPITQDSAESTPPIKVKTKNRENDGASAAKRRCVSTACTACRRRKSKCDGAQPACMACRSVYLTECEYAPHTDFADPDTSNPQL